MSLFSIVITANLLFLRNQKTNYGSFKDIRKKRQERIRQADVVRRIQGHDGSLHDNCEYSGHLESRICSSQACPMAWLHPDRPGLPIFSFYLRSGNVVFTAQNTISSFQVPALFRILRRVALIFLVGLFLNIFPRFARDYDTLRIMGVLQRIALAWGLGAVVVLMVKRNYIWIATLVILIGYWALMYFFGGSDPYSLEGNFARQVDIKILGEKHLYRGFGVPFDPEGLLSTIPAVATVLLGFMAGNLISSLGTSWKTVGWLAITGAALIGAGLLWGQYFPINKPIWTSSYVLYAGGIGMMILALLFMIVDIWGLKGWTGFFNTFGTNALFTYVLAGIWTKTMLSIKIGEVTLYNWIFTHICSPLFEEPEACQPHCSR